MKNSILQKVFCCTIVVLVFMRCTSSNQSSQNLDFEVIDSNNHPHNWKFQNVSGNPIYKIDSNTVQDGNYSLCIENKNSYCQAYVTYEIPHRYNGKHIHLTGYLKKETDTNALISIFIFQLNDEGIIFNRKVVNYKVGTNADWQKLELDVDYLSDRAEKIIIGSSFKGKGKVWVDNFSVLIDNKSIDELKPIIRKSSFAAEKDTSFSTGSRINVINTDSLTIQRLFVLGEIWGFLKYYHPAIAKGQYNWDAALFRTLPKILNAKNNNEYNNVLTQWISSLGSVSCCDNCDLLDSNSLKLPPSFGDLYSSTILSDSLIERLKFIQRNHSEVKNYYVRLDEINKPHFTHENSYEDQKYPDAGLRLLALYRYWNMINYYYPYRHLIKPEWKRTLKEFIPKFLQAKNETEYTLCCDELVGRIQDTHAAMNNDVIEDFEGRYIFPFQSRFIENKLVVTKYYLDDTALKEKIKKGDVIEKINGIPITILIKKYLKYAPGSNYEVQLRNLTTCFGFLVRSREIETQLTINRCGKTLTLTINRIPSSDVNPMDDFEKSIYNKGFSIIDDNIGLLFPALLKDADFDSVYNLFKSTKGMIVDLRCYPSGEMFPYINWVNDTYKAFVKFTYCSSKYPGAVIWGDSTSTGGGQDSYDKPIVVIVNSQTQSAAEYATMGFQLSPNTVTIGSTTAGADGDGSRIIFPGNIKTYISGTGIYYPNGKETQRCGVKIDQYVYPTIEGIKKNKDELIERAEKIINEKCKHQHIDMTKM